MRGYGGECGCAERPLKFNCSRPDRADSGARPLRSKPRYTNTDGGGGRRGTLAAAIRGQQPGAENTKTTACFNKPFRQVWQGRPQPTQPWCCLSRCFCGRRRLTELRPQPASQAEGGGFQITPPFPHAICISLKLVCQASLMFLVLEKEFPSPAQRTLRLVATWRNRVREAPAPLPAVWRRRAAAKKEGEHRGTAAHMTLAA